MKQRLTNKFNLMTNKQFSDEWSRESSCLSILSILFTSPLSFIRNILPDTSRLHGIVKDLLIKCFLKSFVSHWLIKGWPLLILPSTRSFHLHGAHSKKLFHILLPVLLLSIVLNGWFLAQNEVCLRRVSNTDRNEA